jgi:hypothetical protein
MYDRYPATDPTYLKEILPENRFQPEDLIKLSTSFSPPARRRETVTLGTLAIPTTEKDRDSQDYTAHFAPAAYIAPAAHFASATHTAAATTNPAIASIHNRYHAIDPTYLKEVSENRFQPENTTKPSTSFCTSCCPRCSRRPRCPRCPHRSRLPSLRQLFKTYITSRLSGPSSSVHAQPHLHF